MTSPFNTSELARRLAVDFANDFSLNGPVGNLTISIDKLDEWMIAHGAYPETVGDLKAARRHQAKNKINRFASSRAWQGASDEPPFQLVVSTRNSVYVVLPVGRALSRSASPRPTVSFAKTRHKHVMHLKRTLDNDGTAHPGTDYTVLVSKMMKDAIVVLGKVLDDTFQGLESLNERMNLIDKLSQNVVTGVVVTEVEQVTATANGNGGQKRIERLRPDDVRNDQSPIIDG